MGHFVVAATAGLPGRHQSVRVNDQQIVAINNVTLILDMHILHACVPNNKNDFVLHIFTCRLHLYKSYSHIRTWSTASNKKTAFVLGLRSFGVTSKNASL